MDKRLVWFEKLYDNNADAIWRHLFFKLGDSERAKELMQEVFMKTWEYILAGNKLDHEKAFLYKVANNLFINEIRTDKKTISLNQLEADGYEPAGQLDSSQSAKQRELLDNLSRINNNYRTALVLRYIDGLTVKEISRLLNEKETNISMRLSRGLEALKKIYNGI